MPASAEDRLDSWKEIAAYLRRGVRTVRRWERDEGLPVHRQIHRVLGSVYAFKSEIETWRQTGRRRLAPSTPVQGRRTETSLKSIAVLPFANVSTDPENEYFADGLADEVTADLSRIGGLHVISRTSAVTFKRTTKDVSTIARELGVRYIVEGSVRRAGDRLRITAQLIDAATDDHLWADKFDGSIEDVFAIQERLARVIVDALELRLSADENRRLGDRPIADVHAYQCYLRARHEAWRWRGDAIGHAIQLLRNGLALVGDNARLYAALGQAYLQYREAGIDVSERPLQEAEACAEKVFAIEGASPAALLLRGWIHYSRERIQAAVYDLKAALQLDANSADTLLLLTNCYLISGQVTSARPLIDRALLLDPLNPVTRCMPGFAALLEGNLAAAVEPYRQMYEMDPANPMGRLFYVGVLVLNRLSDEARAVANGFPPDLRTTVPARIAFFLTGALAGEEQAVLAAQAEEIERLATAADVFPRMAAQGCALAGMPERAMHWLAIAVHRGFINHPFLAQHDPCLASLRHLAEFQDLMHVVRDRWQRFEP